MSDDRNSSPDEPESPTFWLVCGIILILMGLGFGFVDVTTGVDAAFLGRGAYVFDALCLAFGVGFLLHARRLAGRR